MTTNFPAQPRPPSLPFSYPGLIRQRSFPAIPARSDSIDSVSNVDLLMSSDIDHRPTKRRKVESPSTNSTGGGKGGSDEDGELIEKRKLKYLPPSWLAVSSSIGENGTTIGGDVKVVPSLPAPPRGYEEQEDLPIVRTRTSCRRRASVSVPNTPGTIECSPDTPLLESKRPADYFPWTGKHLEDVINETNVKQGYFDKAPQPLERELNTAKAPLYNAFKHRSGMDSLSVLFSLLLDQKSKHGALSSTSSFRPPPRVTLTETKRKSWIADLADASVPLRRLSRTIPQGIRGLTLLEQCLVHNVPLGRAMWFVKCVGANEIRTLKRKGVNPNITTGAENKWIRDWTVNIQQFWEAAIAQNGSNKWNENLRYTFEFCARLYQDNLLDKDFFLDWIVKSFANCKMEELAIWLSLVQLHRFDLVRFRKRAKQVAFALMSRFQDLVPSTSGKHSLREKLSNAIHSLAMFRPGCFVMPDQWLKLRNAFKSIFNSTDDQERSIVENIENRNELLLGRTTLNEGNTKEKNIIAALDNATTPYNLDRLSQELGDLNSNRDDLCHVCLRWATSRFRGTSSRIYLVSRLLRRWQKIGYDISSTLLAFFTTSRKSMTVCLASYRHLFAELSRTKSFSNSRFLQWVSIKATQSLSTTAGRTASAAMEEHAFLLKDLCLNENESHMKNLRDHILKRTGYYNPKNLRRLADLKEQIQDTLYSESLQEDLTIDTNIIKSFDWWERFDLTRWLRIEAGKLSELAAVELVGKPPLPGSQLFTLEQFLLIRRAVEAAEDISTLADILHILSNTKQESILAALIDTVHCNASSLSAIGALGPLQTLYGQAYLALRATKPSILLFTASLLDLCQHYPCQVTPVRALQHDLVKGDRARVLAACSPFSDGVAESLQQAGVTFFDDFEAILQAEVNMHEQTMISLFTVLVGRITKSGNEIERQSTFNLCQLLARLRIFRPVQADTLIKKWLGRLFGAAWSRTHQSIILELLLTRCVTIDSLLLLSEQAPPASQCKNAIRELVYTGLSLRTSHGRYEQHYYVIQIAINRLMLENPPRAFDVLSSYVNIAPRLIGESTQMLYDVLSDEKKVDVLSQPVKKSVSNLVDQLTGAVQGQAYMTVENLIAGIDILSLPFCRYRFSSVNSEGFVLTDKEVERVGATVFERLHLGLGTDNLDIEFVQAILEILPSNVQCHVRKQVEAQFFDTLPKFFQNKAVMQTFIFTEEEKKRSREAVNKIVLLGPARVNTSPANSTTCLVEKLTMIAKFLGGKVEVGNIASNISTAPISPIASSPQNPFSPQWDVKIRESLLGMLDYLELFIQVTSMKVGLFAGQSSEAPAVSAKATQNDQIKLIALLASIATQPLVLQLLQSTVIEDMQRVKISECMAFAIDVAAAIADELTEESRVLCARFLKDRMRDSRVQWLVGSMNSYSNAQKSDGHGLVMMSETKGNLGEFKPKQWELLESGGGREGDTCLGLGLFGAKRVR